MPWIPSCSFPKIRSFLKSEAFRIHRRFAMASIAPLCLAQPGCAKQQPSKFWVTYYMTGFQKWSKQLPPDIHTSVQSPVLSVSRSCDSLLTSGMWQKGWKMARGMWYPWSNKLAKVSLGVFEKWVAMSPTALGEWFLSTTYKSSETEPLLRSQSRVNLDFCLVRGSSWAILELLTQRNCKISVCCVKPLS